MFSGIIEELGEIKKIVRCGTITVLTIKADKISSDTEIGNSISVNGACLTVIKKYSNSLDFELMPETRKTTNLGDLKIADKVNLERSLRMGDRISGHFVSGHIDCRGVIRKKSYINGNLCFEVDVGAGLTKYCLPKGSIAVDGISLTLAGKRANTFSIYIIPHTLKNTTLGFKGPSNTLNVEFDILAKREFSL